MYELDEDAAPTRIETGRYRVALSDRWSIGTAPNGGYLLAAALAAVDAECSAPDVLTATAHYLRPAEPGPAQIEVATVKAGRRLTTMEARLLQDGRERVRVLSTHGEHAASASGPRYVDGNPPELPALDACLRERPAGRVPRIAERFDFAMDPSSIDFAAGEGPAEIRGHVRFADGRPPDALGLAVMADAFPPPAFHVMAAGWVPTIALTLHFRGPAEGPWIRGRFRTRFVFGGLLEEDGELWDGDQLVVLSRQLALTPRLGA